MLKSPSGNAATSDEGFVLGEPVAAIDEQERPPKARAGRQARAVARPISRADARERWLLLLLVFGALASEQTIGVLMPLAADAQGTSYAWIGMLSGTLRLVLVLLLIPGTWLVASWGRRSAIVVGVGLQGAAALTYAIIPDVRWMLLPQIMLGVGLALFWPAYLSYFAEVVVGAETQMQMRRSLTQGVALLISPLIGPYLAGRFGYGAGFAVIGAMTVTVALFGLRQALGARLKSTGGRPSLGVARRQKIPLDDADWGLLCELAETLADDESRPTPGQVASELLHQRLMEVRDKMGPRDAGPPRSPLRHKRTGTG